MYTYMVPGLDSLQPIEGFINSNLPRNAPGSGIYLKEVYTNLDWESPQALLPFPNNDNLLVVEMDGRFFVVDRNDDTTDRTMVLDIQDRCWYYDWFGPGTKHGGFQNAAFHPDFGKGLGKDFIYVYYVHKTTNEDTDFNAPYYDRLSRFTWTGTSFDPDSELIMINQYDTAKGHDGSGMTFGNDGFLYVTIGDEGTQNAQATPHTQKIDDRFRSGVWRIDVDEIGGDVSHPIRRQPSSDNVPVGSPNSYTQGYYVPNDNPWVNPDGSVLEEFYAIGLRNPFRMTLDSPTGNLWLGDVGGGQVEEIDLLDKPGLNFQWNYKEGLQDGFSDVPSPIIGEERIPIFEIQRSQANAVIGGYVYHGAQIPELEGKYIFANNGGGEIYSLTHTGGNTSSGIELIANAGGTTFDGVSSFGFDQDDELYVLKLSNGTPGGGKIFRLSTVDSSNEPTFPETLSETGIFVNMQDLIPANGIVPYGVNVPFWSAGTTKKRWVAIPTDGQVDSDTERISYSETGPWGFPIGTVFIKHFEHPDGQKLETRLWIRGESGDWFGSTYRWRENGLDADLLLDGAEEELTIENETFSYLYPSSAQCNNCHNQNSGWVLGFNTRQLNKDNFYPSTGRTSNQLETLAHLGLIPEVDENNVLTSVPLADNGQSLEIRARSYLDSNCAHCHLPGNTRATFDTRLGTALPLQNLINGDIIEGLGADDPKVIRPQDISNSILFHRMNSIETNIAMPPLAKGRIDMEAVRLIENYINSLGECDSQGSVYVLGTPDPTNADFLDRHSPHVNIDRTAAYTNTSDDAQEICIGNFSFYAQRLGNPLTPFIAHMSNGDDFTVLSIGETRYTTDYEIGFNNLIYSDHSNEILVLQPGETIVPGFIDAKVDGELSISGQSVIPAIAGDGENDVWQTYLNGGSILPGIVLGKSPSLSSGVAEHLERSYQFGISVTITAYDSSNPSLGNLALNKPTSQSSTDFNGSSSRAVDGNTNGVYSNESVTHTTMEPNAWWRVDLEAIYEINSINVFNRTDCCTDRLVGARIYVGSVDSSEPNDYTLIGELEEDTLDNFDGLSIQGRYVLVRKEEVSFLSLAEIQIFGKPMTTSVTGVAITPNDLTLNVGETASLSAMVSPTEADNQIINWFSSDENIATVDENGSVTAVTAGNVVITVLTNDGGHRAHASITVNSSSVAVAAITLEVPANTQQTGSSVSINATILPENATNTLVLWTSENENTATVDHDGNVTAIAPGSFTIVATTMDGGHSASASGTVVRGPSGIYILWDEHLSGIPLKFVIFPNPNDGVFNLDLRAYSAQSVLVTLFNSTQQKMYTTEFGQGHGNFETINVSHLPNGVYYVVGQSGNQRKARVIIISK